MKYSYTCIYLPQTYWSYIKLYGSFTVLLGAACINPKMDGASGRWVTEVHQRCEPFGTQFSPIPSWNMLYGGVFCNMLFMFNQPTIHFSLFKISTNHSLFILSLYLSSMLKRPDIWLHFFLEREFTTEHAGNSIYQAAESTWEAKPSLATCQCFSFMVCHGQIVGRFPWGASASPSRHHLPVAHGASRPRPFVVGRRPLRWPALRARQRGIASVLPVWT
jgi:hypothetical protein